MKKFHVTITETLEKTVEVSAENIAEAEQMVPDPITEHEKAEYPGLQAYQQAVTLPQMLIKLKQYVGRAIRTENDTAVISILDSRVAISGRYRQAVLGALFDSPVTSQIADVEEFIRQKKARTYYLEGGQNSA